MAQRAARGLCLASSPVFAVMAWLTAAHHGDPGSSPWPYDPLPIDGMAWMYSLMCLFHAGPWIALLTGLLRRPLVTPPEFDGD